MINCCQECEFPLTDDSLTCPFCGQAHRYAITVERLQNPRIAYQASKALNLAGLSKLPLQQLTGALQHNRLILKTQRMMPPYLSNQLLAIGCETTESFTKIPAWQKPFLVWRDKYGLGVALWKPLLILLVIMSAQKVILAAGPSSAIIAQTRMARPIPAQVKPKLEKPAVLPTVPTPRASVAVTPAELPIIDPVGADNTGPAGDRSEGEPVIPPKARESQGVNYRSNSSKDCFFKARRGYRVQIKAYNRCTMCAGRELVWQGTLGAEEESEELKGKQINSYFIEADGKSLSVDSGCFGMMLVPLFDRDLFPIRDEER